MMVPTFYQVNMFVHLVAVALWLGLTLNVSLLMVPLIRDLPEKVADRHMTVIGRRARRTVGILYAGTLVIMFPGVLLRG